MHNNGPTEVTEEQSNTNYYLDTKMYDYEIWWFVIYCTLTWEHIYWLCTLVSPV